MQTRKESAIVPLETLEKKAGTLQILVYIYTQRDKGKVNITNIQDSINVAKETAKTTIEYLILKGYLEHEKVKSYPPQHLIWLTEKGLKVAEKLLSVAHSLRQFEHTPKTKGV